MTGRRTSGEMQLTAAERSHLMGDKMGKKDKAKQSRQKDAKKAKKAKKKQDLQATRKS